MQMSNVTVFVLTMGSMQLLSSRRNQYTLQYLSEKRNVKLCAKSADSKCMRVA